MYSFRTILEPTQRKLTAEQMEKMVNKVRCMILFYCTLVCSMPRPVTNWVSNVSFDFGCSGRQHHVLLLVFLQY